MTSPTPSLLQRNLAVIKLRDKALFQRICLPVSDDHIQKDGQGKSHYRIHRTWYPFDLTPDQVQRSLGRLKSSHVFLFGLGRGEQLLALLDTPVESVLAWDRDPWLLRLLLMEHDLTGPLKSGRLRLALGVDLLDAMKDKVPREGLIHPILAGIYTLEFQLLQKGLQEKRALICAGTLFVDDLAEALQDEGYSVLTWDIASLSPEELARTARHFKASLVASINYNPGLAEACRALDLRLVIWEIDPATDTLQPCDPPAEHCRVFTYRRAQVPVYQAAGFPHAEYLPLAANPGRRQPVELSADEQPRYRAPLSFVGASMVAQAQQFREEFITEYCLWKGGSPDQARGAVEAILDKLVQDHREDLTTSRVEEMMDEGMAPFVATMRANPEKPDPIALVSEIVAADKRLVYVANLGQLGIRVWGDKHWQGTQAHGAKYMGNAGHKREITRIYCGSTVNVDIGRIYQTDMVTMRVFDVMACGGFVLTERNEALLELFTPGVEMDCYTTLQELLEKADHYIRNPGEAAAMAARGREAVLRDHTISGRVRHMLDSLSG